MHELVSGNIEAWELHRVLLEDLHSNESEDM